jgi:hypothetical protein
VNSLLVKELFAPGMADAVIGHEKNHRLVKDPFPFQAVKDLADLAVGVTDRIKIPRPVIQQDRVRRIIRGQFQPIQRSGGAQFLPQGVDPPRVAIPQFAPIQLDLGEKGLPRPASGPVVAVIHGGGPGEIVIGFAQMRSPRRPAAVAGVIPSLLKEGGQRRHPGRQLDRVRPPAAVMMGPDAGLIHPGDQGGAKGGTDRGGGKGPGEASPLSRQPVQVRGLDGGLPVRGDVG